VTGPNPIRLTVIDYEPIPNITPKQAELATRRIAERALDVEDARLLLDMVFGGKRCIRRPKGTVGKKVPHRTTYKYPCPVGPDGHHYRLKVRAWGRAQGLKFISTGPVEGWLLNAYVEATGDVWPASTGKVGAA